VKNQRSDAFKLQGTQIPVQALVNSDQLLVTAAFNDLSFFKHNNLVRFADGGQAMGDDDRSTAFHQFFQRLLYQAL
jgi:hypothetical protein